MATTDRIRAVRDLVGTFSVFLDEFSACWGALRIANDQLRSAVLLDLIEDDQARDALAGWIEPRLEGEQRHLVAPLASLIWSCGRSTTGAAHGFEASLDRSAERGARQLSDALTRAFEAHHATESGGGVAPHRTRIELLGSVGAARHWFGLPPELEEQLDHSTGVLWAAALDRYFRDADVAGVDDALPTAAKTRGWWSRAIVGQAEMLVLPGLQIRHYTLTPLLPPQTVTVLQLAESIDDVASIRERFGPALVTAWDSLGHAFGDETDESELDDHHRHDDPFAEGGDYGERMSAEAAHMLDEGSWFAGLLALGDPTPRLGGGVRALLAHHPGDAPHHSGDPHFDAIISDARGSLERLAANLGDEGAAMPAFRAKASALTSTTTSEADRALGAYVLRVVEGVTAVSDEAATFAEHLDVSAEGEQAGDLALCLRLAAIVAWLDAARRWIVSDAVSPPVAGLPERAAVPPIGHRDPAKILHEVAGSMPESYAVEEYQLVVEQLEAQWDEIAVLDDQGAPDFEDDWSDLVDIDGFAAR